MTYYAAQPAPVSPTFNSAASGPHTVDAKPTAILLVANASGNSITVTITTPATDIRGNAVADEVFTVPNNATAYAIPLDERAFGNPATITFSASTSVTFAVITR